MAPSAPFEQYEITRRALGPRDVAIQVKFAGICHSDIHQAREEWGKATFPMVPGHEIGGVVVAVGAEVTNFTVGQHAGVGCMVDSCLKCDHCAAGNEQFCVTGCVFTYNGKYKYEHSAEYTAEGGNITYGGYSESIVVDSKFCLAIPQSLDLAAATPLLCAGITCYSPLKRFGLQKGQKLAVAGLGGLGHMGVKLGVAMGAEVTVISRGAGKKEEALGKLGAHAFLDSTDPAAFAAAAGTFDFILDTIAADHDIAAYLGLLRAYGKCVLVGVPPKPLTLHAFNIVGGGKTLAGSLIGGIVETQEMLDFCAEHKIVCEIEVIAAKQISEAYDRAVASDVKYRFVIDTATF
jgi:uncharacterized zinc-type alcohol dehydrogenase-like protein